MAISCGFTSTTGRCEVVTNRQPSRAIVGTPPRVLRKGGSNKALPGQLGRGFSLTAWQPAPAIIITSSRPAWHGAGCASPPGCALLRSRPGALFFTLNGVYGRVSPRPLVYGYRTYRFGVHYARELFVQFLVIDGPHRPNATE